MAPFFTVIMPVYNVEKVLPTSLDSVLRQDDSDFELILVDDGTKDSSGQICDEYAAKYDFIRVIHKPNGGLSSARNVGIENARGEYILMPDSDDYIEPNTLTVVREAIRAAALRSDRPVDIVRYDRLRHEGDEVTVNPTGVPVGLYEGDDVRRLVDMSLLDPDHFPIAAWLHAYRRGFLEENGLRFVSEREVLSEDYLFLNCAFIVAKSIYVTNEPLYHYIIRAGSLTTSPVKNAPGRYTSLYKHLMEFAAGHGGDEELLQKISTFYIEVLIYGYCIAPEYRGVYPEHGWKEARQSVKEILKNPTVRSAAGNVYRPALSKKHILRAKCIHMGWETPIALTQLKWKNAVRERPEMEAAK